MDAVLATSPLENKGDPLSQGHQLTSTPTSDANSFGASPTIPEALTPLPEKRASLNTANAAAVKTVPRRIHFDMAPEEFSTPPGRTIPGGTYHRARESNLSPIRDRKDIVGCDYDSKTRTFHTAKKAERPSTSLVTPPMTPQTPKSKTYIAIIYTY